MGRPALDPAIKAARYEAARTEARRLNRGKLPAHVYAFGMPTGKVYVRYEPAKGSKVMLRSPVGSPEFFDEIAALMRGTVIPPARPPATSTPRSAVSQPGTWQALCEEFLTSSAFLRYSERCRRVRRNVLERTWSEPINSREPNGLRFGQMPMEHFRFRAISTLQERFARIERTPDEMYPEDRNKDRHIPTTPEAGNSVVRYIRAFFEWAKEHHTKLVDGRNWAREVRLFPSSHDGWRPWKAEHCAAYEACHPPGTKARLVYDLARYSAQRLADVARLGPEMVGLDPKGRDRLSLLQTKNRNTAPVTAYVPLVPPLVAALKAAQESKVLGERSFIATSKGSQYGEQSLGNYFRRCCKKAGLTGLSMHGLRKTAVIALIEAGCTWHEIMSITGHRSRKEIERYGREFYRGTASSSAFDRLLAGLSDLSSKGDTLPQAA